MPPARVSVAERLKFCSELDLAYLAGVVDGEGTISVQLKMKGDGYQHLRAELKVPNTSMQLLTWIETTFGGNLSKRPDPCLVDCSRHHVHRWKAAKVWSVSQRQLAPLLPRLLPYLKVKHQAALEALEFCILQFGEDIVNGN